MRKTLSAHVATFAVLAFCAFSTVLADADYIISDTHAELVLSLDPDETLVYMNTFPVDPQGQYIDLIRTSYGRVGGPSSLNGIPVKILLYEDPDGGSPQNGTLLWSQDAVVANGNTDTLNQYAVPHVLVHGTLVAAVYFHNTSTGPVYITPLDTTAPSYSQRSFFGYVGEFMTLDPANLSAIPPTQWFAQEDRAAGNYRIEARGRSDDGITVSVSRVFNPDALRLSWAGSQPPYDVERASQSDFSDAVVIAPGLTATTYDDPVTSDGLTWFYRVR